MSAVATFEALEKEETSQGVLRYPTREDGDVKVTWDKKNPAEVENARKTFNDLKAKGYRAFSGPKLDNPINTFDPEVNRIALLPLIAGG